MSTYCSERRQNILVYSDEDVLGMGAANVLSSAGHFDVTLAGSELSCLIPAVQRNQPDVILIDLSPGITLEWLSSLRMVAPAARVILWGREFSRELTSQVHELGGVWLLPRCYSKDRFLDEISRIASGAEPVAPRAPEGSRKIALTNREAQLVALLAQGLSNKKIGACLGITEGTVRIYLSKLFLKVGAKHRFELAVFGWKNLHCGHAFGDGPPMSERIAEEESARPVLRSLFLAEPKGRGTRSPVAETPMRQTAWRA